MDALARIETEMAVLARRVESASRRSTTFREMDRASYLIARTLDVTGPSSVNELARVLGLDGSTVTRQVATMEARSQVSRRPHPDDGRVWVISLTAAGRRAMAKIGSIRRERFAESLSAWSESDVDTFSTLLQRFNADLAGADAGLEAINQKAMPTTRRGDHRQSIVSPRRTT